MQLRLLPLFAFPALLCAAAAAQIAPPPAKTSAIFKAPAAADAPARANDQALVKAEQSLTLRATPSLTGKRVETLLRFQPVRLLERKTVEAREWARIKTVKADASKSSEGWVLASYLTLSGFAASSSDSVNVRGGPGTNYDVRMRYGKNYPVQVLDLATNGWAKIRDVDGDMGWVHPDMLSLSPPYVMTSGAYEVFNVRAAAGTDSPIKFRAEKGYLMQVLGEKDGWLNVKDKDGEEGWISAKIVFGWLDRDYPKEP